ncbi:zincin-like metallopeptidase domain-containing protein [Tenacibaculum maritimum]|uniref:zincin-like metallopeptidase domain-containing protein n=1 Tax=Tenacibaculum maritimum TaxID=107401 RepID=UPI003875E9AE
MISTSKFQALHNKEIERSYLEELLQEARKEGNTNVVYRISKILRENPNDLDFTLKIKQFNEASVNAKLEEALTTNGDLKNGWVFKNGSVVKSTDSLISDRENDFLTAEVLAGLDFIQADDEELKTTLGKAVSPKEIYKMITEKVIEGVESVKGNPAMPWDKDFIANGGYLVPHNFDTKKAYRSVNILLLKNGDPYAGFTNPYFLTFKQIKKLKGKVKPNSKGIIVVYFTRLYQIDPQDGKKGFSTYKKEKMIEFFKSNGYNPKQFDLLVNTIPILKYYKVFNGSDIEGIDFKINSLNDFEKAKLGYVPPSKAKHNDKKNQIAELIIQNLPTPKVKIEHKENGAFYFVKRDVLNMPSFESFNSANDYYRVLFHELIHSTGHPKRLNRELGNAFGTAKYAKEELIAEFGAVFLSAQAGILWHTHKDHEKYIKNWIFAVSLMGKDNTLLMRCATAAQKATDFLLQVNESKEPKFYKDLKKIIKQNKAVEVGKQLQFTLNGASKDHDTFAYNKQIMRAAKKGFDKDDIFILGTPKGVLSEYVENFNIQHQGALLQKSIIEKHSLNWGHFIDLPEKLNNPLYIFKSTSGNKNELVIVVSLKDVNGNKVVVPIRLNKNLRVITITSVYGKDNPSFISNWEEKGLLLYKKSASNGTQTAPIAAAPKETQNKDSKNSLNAPDVEIVSVEDYPVEELGFIESLPSPTFPTKKNDEFGPVIIDHQNIISDHKKELVRNKVEIPTVKIPMITKPTSKTSSRRTLEDRKNAKNQVYNLFDIRDKDISEFLGEVEKKDKESVVITLAGEQGSGKTRFLFQLMNTFGQKYRVGHASMEEHSDSKIYRDKEDEYINDLAYTNIDNPEIKTIEQLDKLIRENDVILIDSFAKLRRINKKFDLDEDLRKKYDGKLFIIIYQLTSDGKMRGGSESQFDGDIILFVEKDPDYRKSYVYANKNRYQNKPLHELHFNIFVGKLNQILKDEGIEEVKQHNEEVTEGVFTDILV